MFFRVIQEGHVLVYAPEALVWLHDRRDYDALRSQLMTWGRGFHAHLRRNRRAYPEERIAIVRLLLWWWKEYGSSTLIGMFRGSSLASRLRRWEVLGAILGVGSYDRAARAATRLLAAYPDEPTIVPRLSAPRQLTPRSMQTVAREVRIDTPVTGGIEDIGDASRVHVTVSVATLEVSRVTAVPEGNRVSAVQLHDAIAVALAKRLLSVRPEAVKDSLRCWLTTPWRR
jgi:hypothetical protein